MTHRWTGRAQIWLSIIFIGGYFLILWYFVTGRATVPADLVEVVKTLLSVLTAGILTIVNYWFSRQRVSVNDKEG